MTHACNSTLPNVIQVKELWKTINIEEALEVISQIEKGDQIVDICHNVRFIHNSVHKIHDNSERIKESAKSETNMFL